MALLQAVHAELGLALAPSPLTAFPGFPVTAGLLVPAAASPTIQFLKSSPTPDEFLIVTGMESHYLLSHPTVDPCAAHIWSECHALHENHGDAPIVSRSYDPASFFTTIESHHCAHRTVHNRRASRCYIAPFEEFLCCRACIFQAICWTPDELQRLPCGVVVANTLVPLHNTAADSAIAS
jgi:hypothetical protein